MIVKITRMYTRTYTDNGQVTTYVEWMDNKGKTGRTEGPASNGHMKALIEGGQQEGLQLEIETW